MAEGVTFKDLVTGTMDDLSAHIAKETTAVSSQTDEAHDTLTIAALRAMALDVRKFVSWYVALDSDLDDYKLAVSTTVPADGKVVVQPGFSAEVASGTLVHLFLLLSPEEAKLACTNGLRDCHIESRVVVPFDVNVTQYDLTATAPSLRVKEQILRMRVRDVASGQAKPMESELPAVYPYNEDGSVRLILPDTYASEGAANKALIVEYRKYYDTAPDWSDTVQMVSPRLVRAVCKHEALKLIFQVMGPGAKAVYGQAMVLAERDRSEQEARWNNNVVKRDHQTEEDRISGLAYDPYQTWY